MPCRSLGACTPEPQLQLERGTEILSKPSIPGIQGPSDRRLSKRGQPCFWCSASRIIALEPAVAGGD